MNGYNQPHLIGELTSDRLHFIDAYKTTETCNMKECNQCGKCCTKYSNGRLSASASDIALWDKFSPDITRYVNDGKIWMDPDTGEQIELCPWLRKLPHQNSDQIKYICAIYDDRPDDCRYYPVTIEQMIDDECEMLEAQDLKKPKQAQRTLNTLMAESRPPFE